MAERTERILTLLGPLSDGSYPSVDTISRKYGISRRTLFRDLKEIRKAGLAVRFDRPKKGYLLVSQHTTPSTPSPDDLLELLRMAITSVLPQSRTQRRRAQRAIERLTKDLPEETQREIEWLDTVVLARCAGKDASRVLIDRIVRASGEQKLVDVEIDSGDNGNSRLLRVLPQRVRCDVGKWLLEGVLVASHRSLRAALDRISDVHVLEHVKTPRLSKRVLDWSQADIEIT